MNNFQETKSLVSGFIDSTLKFSHLPAIEVENNILTYSQLAQISGNISAAISARETENRPLAAILAHRSIVAYAGILGTLLSGKGYVPLSPKFPLERTHTMLMLSNCNVLIVGKECYKTLEVLLPKLEKAFVIVLPDTLNVADLAKCFPLHSFIGSNDILENSSILKEPGADPESTAYLLFTSGSTGIPKGVPVSHNNVITYISYICQRYNINENDRFSQTFDTTFDLSVHDMFVCWQRGACLFCIPEKSVLAPAKFIKDKKLTIWFSVPSVAMFMDKLGMLKPASFPSIRYSFFCGEAFAATLAMKWQEAAQNSIIDNLYGPTETTIAITHYRWESRKSPAICVNGIVPIGFIFEGQKKCIIGQDQKLVAIGEPGELWLAGSQVTKGYLNNPAKTHEQYIKIESLGKDIWYKTGDLVMQDKDGCLYYLGRIDNQVKLFGHRVELEEIDSVLRKASGVEICIAIAYSKEEGAAKEIIGFICGDGKINELEIISYCKKYLPEYMVPARVYSVEKIPLNSNGKIDRLKLSQTLRDVKN